jgi:hypothetical protein
MHKGKRDDERRALPFAFAGSLDGAAVQLDEVTHQRKAQPRPPVPRCAAVSPCQKRWKMNGSEFAEIPTPVSVTVTFARPPEFVSAIEMSRSA